MKIRYFLLIILAFSSLIYSQGRTYIYDSFSAKIENSILRVLDKNKNLVLEKKFNDPYDLSADLDGDGADEYLVIDDLKQDDKDFYTIFIFHTADSFYAADSIPSGCLEPFQTNSEETGGTIIVAGNPKFDSLNPAGSDSYVPVNCWQYQNEKASLINNKIYKLFVAENDTLLDVIDAYYNSNGSDCKSTGKMKGLIATVYANYMHASDKLLASQFLKRYYHCDDMEDFRKKINSLL